MLMSEKTERSRQHARAALDSYRAAHHPADDGTPRNADWDDAGAIGDLIADLLHLLDVVPNEHDDDGPVSIQEATIGTAFDHYSHESDPDNANEGV